jgi:hypothetical protein
LNPCRRARAVGIDVQTRGRERERDESRVKQLGGGGVLVEAEKVAMKSDLEIHMLGDGSRRPCSIPCKAHSGSVTGINYVTISFLNDHGVCSIDIETI